MHDWRNSVKVEVKCDVPGKIIIYMATESEWWFFGHVNYLRASNHRSEITSEKNMPVNYALN